MAMFLVVFPLSLLSKLYLEANGHTTLLACLIFIWMNDTGAFCVGSLIGRHRLFERISPKKSWEGFWGGLFFTIVAAVIIATHFFFFFPAISTTEHGERSRASECGVTFADRKEKKHSSLH